MDLRLRKLAGGVAGFTLAVLFAGACAGDAEDDTPGGARGRYIERADPICREMHDRVGTLGDDPAGERAAIQSALDRLRALGIPGEESERLEVFLVELSNMTANLEDIDQSRRVNDQRRVGAAQARLRETDQRASQAADRYGFRDPDGCVKRFGTA